MDEKLEHPYKRKTIKVGSVEIETLEPCSEEDLRMLPENDVVFVHELPSIDGCKGMRCKMEFSVHDKIVENGRHVKKAGGVFRFDREDDSENNDAD